MARREDVSCLWVGRKWCGRVGLKEGPRCIISDSGFGLVDMLSSMVEKKFFFNLVGERESLRGIIRLDVNPKHKLVYRLMFLERALCSRSP